MGAWFLNQRQDFIRAQLEAFGQIRRDDIAKRFEVTVQIASADIAKFIADNPDAIIYDGRAKCYVLDDQAYTPKAQPLATTGDEALREALEPVIHWYQHDEEPERPLADILADVVADLQHDRALVLRANALHFAGANLSICAQTTGGVAGPDAALMLAIRQWAEADEPFRAAINAAGLATPADEERLTSGGEG